MIIAPAYASRCVTKTQNGSDFHLQGITCFHLIHDSLRYGRTFLEYDYISTVVLVLDITLIVYYSACTRYYRY